MAFSQVNLGEPVFTEAKDDGSGGDNWSYKTCKAPVKSSPPTNQHQAFCRPDALPVAPTNIVKALKETLKSDDVGRLGFRPRGLQWVWMLKIE